MSYIIPRHLLICAALSQEKRQQLKVVQTIGELREKEKKLDHLKSLLVPTETLNREAAIADEELLASCFFCNKRCSHSKLSLRVQLDDLGLKKKNSKLNDPEQERKKKMTKMTKTTKTTKTSGSVSGRQQQAGHGIDPHAEEQYPNEPDVDCTTVLGHLVHKTCFSLLQEKNLLVNITEMNASNDSVDVNSNDFKHQVLAEDLCLLRGLLGHKNVQMDNEHAFSPKALRVACKRLKILVLEQDPDAIGMDLNKSAKKLESSMSSYNTYQTNFCEKFQIFF